MTDDSRTNDQCILAQLVLPFQANAAGNVHGGEIMKMMDSAAGVAAQKHSRTNVVTARVDELEFRRPVYVGNLVTCTAQVIYTGVTSMEIFVTVESEDMTDGKGPQIALTAFFTMVSLDENGLPAKVPPVKLSGLAYDQKLYNEGKKRYLANKEKNRRRMKNPEK